MTDKRKKRARALSKKTGMKHQAAINSLEANEKALDREAEERMAAVRARADAVLGEPSVVEVDDSTPKGLDHLFRHLGLMPADISDMKRNMPKSSSKAMVRSAQDWYRDIRTAHLDGREHSEEYLLVPIDLSYVFPQRTDPYLLPSPGAGSLPDNWLKWSEIEKREVANRELGARLEDRWPGSNYRATKEGFEKAYPELFELWGPWKGEYERGRTVTEIVEGRTLSYVARNLVFDLIDETRIVLAEQSTTYGFRPADSADLEELDALRKKTFEALDKWTFWKKHINDGKV